VTKSRHRHVRPRPAHRRIAPTALAAAGVVLSGYLALGHADDPARPDTGAGTGPPGRSFEASVAATAREWPGVSRSEPGGRPLMSPRALAPETAHEGAGVVEPEATGHRYLTEDLNLWTGPGESFDLREVLPDRSRVDVTGLTVDGWAEVVVDGSPGWVNATYLSKDKPVEPTTDEAAPTNDEAAPTDPGSISAAPCASGSEVESGLMPNTIKVHRAVCARFPEVTSYGGLRSDGEHGQGLALDIMVSSQGLGDEIASWLQVNSSRLGISELLWAQQIWTVQRSSEGWRTFPDRGSVTANHFDHVHVTVYG